MDKVHYGYPPTLFPVIASVEDKATSILFAMISMLRPFRNDLLESIGRKAYKSGNDFTAALHPSFGGKYSKKDIPDGIILLEQQTNFSALVEVKIKGQDLSVVQLDNYLERVKQHRFDALITISNELCSDPSSPPLRLKSPNKSYRKILHYHWSWRYILHRCKYLYLNHDFETELEAILLKQFIEFLESVESGVEGYSRMPSSWKPVVSALKAGAKPDSTQCEDIVEGWFQETSELALILSSKFGGGVCEILEEESQERRRDAAVNNLMNNGDLLGRFKLQDLKSPLEVRLDIDRRLLKVSIMHNVPKNVKKPFKQIEHFLKAFHDDGELDQWGGHKDVDLFVFWPHSKNPTHMSMFEAIQRSVDDELKNSKLINPDKDRIMAIQIAYTPSGVSSKIQSNKGVVALLEETVEYFTANYAFIY